MNPTDGYDPGAPGMGPAQERQALPSGGPTTVLLFSNGHGEDAVGACIARRLREVAPHIRAWAAPIVGEGLAYRRAGVPVVVPTRGRDPSLWSRDLQAALDAAQPDLVVLAGFLARVPPPVVAAYAGRMLNLHPALLPAFGGPGLYGRRVHEAVLRAGVRVTGATVHWVTDELDAGPIVAQWPVPVLPGDTPDTLAARVQQVEHRLLPATVEALLRGGAPPAPPPFHFAPAAAPPSVEELPRWMPPAR